MISLLLILSFLVSAEREQEICLSEEEFKLYEAINSYRESQGLSSIPLSSALSKVAQVHARDLEENFDSENKADCNMHSWSKKGDWSSCCYTNDHSKAECMWDKPKEISGYNSPGFEISYFFSSGPTAETSLKGWQSSSAHNEVITNQGNWQEIEWKAVGVGIYGKYATVWFGQISDTNSQPKRCNP